MPLEWQTVHRLLLVCCDPRSDIAWLNPVLLMLRQALPTTQLTLLTLTPIPQNSLQITRLEVITISEWGMQTLDLHDSPLLIQGLSDGSFDAAILFTLPGQSPYAWGYLCYLAGIPIRIGQSHEFGGTVLSSCIAPPLDPVSTADYYLHLVRSLNLVITEKSQLAIVS